MQLKFKNQNTFSFTQKNELAVGQTWIYPSLELGNLVKGDREKQKGTHIMRIEGTKRYRKENIK